MIARLIQVSLRYRRLVLAASLVFLLYGALLVPQQTWDAFPSVAPMQASVETEAPGLVAEQVEELVTRPIENALAGTPGVATIRSKSQQGLSVITLAFTDRAQPSAVRQAITERLAHGAASLPPGVSEPNLSPSTAAGADLLTLGFTSGRLTPMALRTVVDWTVRPRLMAAAGVANVQIYGGEVRRIEVRARAGDLSDSDLGYADVFNAVRRATGVTGAGFIDTPLQRIVIEPHGQALTTDDIAAGQIQIVGSAPTRISDVADIVEAPGPLIGDALIMGRPAVIARITAQYGVNTLAATKAVEQAISALKPALERQGIEVTGDLDRPASFIAAAVRSLVWQLAIAMGLVALLLVVALRDWRAGLVGGLGIALSLCAALVTLNALGWTLNSATLGGLAVGLGLVVDDAVLDLENLLRRLRDAEFRHDSRSHAVLMASLEVRAPVIYASVLVVVGLLPLALLAGPPGLLLRPLAVSIMVMVLASMAVSVSVSPALARLLLNHIGPAWEPAFAHRIVVGYDALLARVFAAPRGLWLGTVAGLILLAGTSFALFRTEFAPNLHTGRLVVEVDGPPSASLAVMRDYGSRIGHDMVGVPGVVLVSQRTGRSETGDDPAGPGHATLEVQLRPHLSDAEQEDVANRVRKILAGYPGFGAQFRSGLAASEDATPLSGASQVRIFGSDLTQLDRVASRVAVVLAATPGVSRVSAPAPSEAPAVRIDLNFQRLAIFGLSASDVLDTVQTAFAGRPAAQIYAEGRATVVAVTAQVGLRQDPDGVGDLLLRSSSGVSVPLRTVANVYLTSERSQIEHDNGARRQIVTVETKGDDAVVLRRAKARIERLVDLPPGLYLDFVTPDNGVAARNQLLRNTVFAACGMLAILLVAFGGIRSSLFILGSTVFAFIGGVAAVALTGGILSLGALVGFVALFGLSARNGALLISRLDDLVSAHRRPPSQDTVRLAARQRLWAILVGGLVVAGAVLPFALESGQPGSEIVGPMAFVILSGLISSTVLSLCVSPLLAHHVWRPRGMPHTEPAPPPDA